MKVYYLADKANSFRQNFIGQESEGRGPEFAPSLKIYLTKKDAKNDKFTLENDFGEENLAIREMEISI